MHNLSHLSHTNHLSFYHILNNKITFCLFEFDLLRLPVTNIIITIIIIININILLL